MFEFRTRRLEAGGLMTARGLSSALLRPMHLRTARLLVVSVLSLIAALAAPASVHAQSATNTSAVEGRVTDESGGALPGVSVTMTSPALQTPQLDTQTDESG